MRWGLLVVTLQLAACVQSEAVTCPSGITCPPDNVCDDARMRCIAPDQMAACASQADGTSCSFSGADGSCKAGICELFDCGNGIKEPGEQCDGSDFGTDDCTTFGYYFPEGLICNADCSFDRSACGGTCGDGAKNGHEQCDGMQLDKDCTSFGYYKTDGLACSACQYDTTACHDRCGDGIKNGPELCDGAPPLETCYGIGFDAGKLLCSTAACTFALGSCSRFNWIRETVESQTWATIHGSGQNNVWVGGDAGELAHYDGSVWTRSSTGFGDSISQLWVISSTDVWARVSGGLQHFNGAAWAKDSTARSDVTGIWASGPNDVWAIGSNDADVQRWNGSAWVSGGTAVATPILIHGSSASDVWVFTKDGQASHWNGTAWSNFTFDQTDQPVVDALFVRAQNDAWAVGANRSGGPFVAHWNGASWTVVEHHTGSVGEFTHVQATATNDVWILDDKGGGEHFDGVQWTPFDDTNVSALYFPSTGDSFALSRDRNEILRNHGLVVAKSSFDAGQLGWYVFSTLDGHTFVSEQGSATGSLRHHDGVTWLPTETVCAQLVRVIWGAAGNDVWASCGSDLLHWDGIQWKGTTPPSAVVWFSLWGSGTSDIWAGGLGGNVIHWDGQNWTHRDVSPVQPSDRVDWITGTGPSDVWAGTVQHVLFHWTGSAWTRYTPPFFTGAMVATAPNEVVIADNTNTKQVQRGNGATWTALPLPDEFTGGVYKIGAAARDDVFAASGNGMFGHFNGTEWTMVRGEVIGELSMNARSIVYIAGDRIARIIRVRPWACRTSEAGFCDDGIDNDCDGAMDRVDSDCP